MPDHSFLTAFQRESCNPLQDCKHNGSAHDIWLPNIDILRMVLMLLLKVLKNIVFIFAIIININYNAISILIGKFFKI